MKTLYKIFGVTMAIVAVEIGRQAFLWLETPRYRADTTYVFSGDKYRVRVSGNQIETAMFSAERGTALVFLSVDRRVFGADEKPGPPRIVCEGNEVCSDRCAIAQCNEVTEGWYRLSIIPAAFGWHSRESSILDHPKIVLCGEDGHTGLELRRGASVHPAHRQLSRDAKRWNTLTRDELMS
jgi:hypothetical protein